MRVHAEDIEVRVVFRYFCLTNSPDTVHVYDHVIKSI